MRDNHIAVVMEEPEVRPELLEIWERKSENSLGAGTKKEEVF